jgi:hypothetical protein
MPQLIAMVIVVVGAMIYMFQTFGGTGDKVEGLAQKTSIVTEINNIRSELAIALKRGDVKFTTATDKTTLKDLAELGYFSKQIKEQLLSNNTAATATGGVGQTNTYSAISFGGKTNPGLNITLVVGGVDKIPGIRVQLLNALDYNKAFLESQVAEDLDAQAAIDRTTADGASVELTNGNVPVGNRPIKVVDNAGNAGTVASGIATLGDGIFTLYFTDLGVVSKP